MPWRTLSMGPKESFCRCSMRLEGIQAGGGVTMNRLTAAAMRLGLGLFVDVEQALADDAEGEEQRLGMDIEGAGLPAGGDLGGVPADDVAVGGDALPMEGRRGQPALAHVQGLLAGEEAVAEERAGPLHDERAAVAALVIDHDLLDEGGVVELIDVTFEAAGSGRGRRSGGRSR